MKYISLILVSGSIILSFGCKKNSDDLGKWVLLGLPPACSQDDPAAGVTGIEVFLSPNTSWLLYPSGMVSITASVANDPSGQGVTWSISDPVGTVTGQTKNSLSYAAPASETVKEDVTITATSIADGGKTASLKISIIPDTGDNIHPITVDGGPVPGQYYPNGVFTTVNICPSGSTSNCSTVSGILVDTGSYGLRILKSQLSSDTISNLAKEPGTTGGTVLNNCAQFLDGTSLWGWVAQADITIGGETAPSTPIQVVSDDYPMPSGCNGPNENTPELLGANGVLGVGMEPYDFAIMYYKCTASSCSEDYGILPSKRVTNPIINFTGDNNGVILALPSISGTAAAVTGSMIFGIATRANNVLDGATTVYTVNSSDNFTTIYKGISFSNSFIDSGSNGLFFDDSSIRSGVYGWYIPACPLSLTAVNRGANSNQGSVSFSIDNAYALLNSGYAAFDSLGGTAGFQGFDWGLPFFYGRFVYIAIDGTSQPAPYAAPYWAY